VLWLTLGIGLLNLALGFVLGVYMGYGPPTLRYFGQGAGDPVAVPTPPASMEGAIQQAAARQAELNAAVATPPEAGLPTLAPPSPVPPEAPAQPEPTWDLKLDDRLVESSVLHFNVAMARSEAQTAKLDTRLRGCRGQYDEGTVRECLASLKTDCQEFLQEHKQLLERFHTRAGELGDLQSLGQEIETANAELATQVQTTLEALDKIDIPSDLRTAGERLLEEIDQLRSTRHRLRDEQETAYLSLARQEGRLLEVDPQLQHDPLTKLSNRIGIETTLTRWWAEGRQQSQPFSAATIDLDHFASLNAEHGVEVGDRILVQLGQWVAEMAGADSLVARTGQRFLVAVPGNDLAALGPKVETLRQSIGQTTFVHDGQTMAVAATAALVAATPSDTPTAILEKLDRSLAAAKESGRNQSVVEGEQGPSVLKLPDLAVQTRTVTL